MDGKRGRGRPATGIRRPVVTMRLHEDIYEEVKEAAARNKLTISEELARRVSLTLPTEVGGARFIHDLDITVKMLFMIGRLAQKHFARDVFVETCGDAYDCAEKWNARQSAQKSTA